MAKTRLGRLDVELAGNRIALTGRLDEGAVLGELVGRVPPGEVVIDTGGVTFINSIGTCEWMRFLRALRGRGGTIVLERVADVLMTQMNLVADLAAGAEIRSFHAQYLCPACGAEHAPLVDAIAHRDALKTMQAPRVPCPECGAQMDLGDFPERYLSIFKV